MVTYMVKNIERRKPMLPTKLHLIGRPADDVHREFEIFLRKTKREYPAGTTDETKRKIDENFNEDINGFINWFESLRRS